MFKKLAEKLTLSKPSEEQLSKHKQRTQERDRRLKEFSATDSILKQLSRSYLEHKKDIAPSRYEAHKSMIEKALRDLRQALSESGTKSSQNSSKTSGKLQSLLNSAKTFATIQEPAADCVAVNTSSKDKLREASMSATEIENDLVKLDDEISVLKQGYRNRRDLLEELEKSYKNAKDLNPIERYAKVKLIIKSTVRTYEKLATPTAMKWKE